MGAMLRFKKETGKEVTELSQNSLSELCTYLFCCVASACAADKKSFKMSLLEFADALAPDALEQWAQDLAGNTGGQDGDEKKS